MIGILKLSLYHKLVINTMSFYFFNYFFTTLVETITNKLDEYQCKKQVTFVSHLCFPAQIVTTIEEYIFKTNLFRFFI